MANFYSKSLWLVGCLSSAVLWAAQAQAGIIIQGSRVVYPAKDREVSVKMTNVAKEPSLVQAWVDKGNDKQTPDKADGPFLITPPITRVEANKGQTLRLVYTGDEAAAKKQETVFWLNVIDVPPMPMTEGTNFLQVAVRSRLKIFFRPEGLPGNPTKAAEDLSWSVVPSGQGFAIRTRNDSAFHVSLANVSLDVGGKSHKVKTEDVKMVAPGATQDFALPGLSAMPGAGAKVSYEWVSDYGAVIKQDAKF
ncbi:molecular chaperone [Pseudomonas sp. Irchel s3a18]|uniref:fimbrial biogenesis chaperone n=1 Tax=Pseudomonas sp. Irchel s3a18 TaxID=2009053 RepID=UPI000BA46320|nr:fimbria/pilus periplasmic chaperone [Pseudomonas sp. Irchel s3a18]